MIQVASYTGEEDANLNISLEYAATIDASNDTIGRKSTIPVHLHFLPSLEVWPFFSHGPSMIFIGRLVWSSVAVPGNDVPQACMHPAGDRGELP